MKLDIFSRRDSSCQFAKGCFEDQFYCADCLNQEGFCKHCDKEIPHEVQKRIGKYLDTGDSSFKTVK